MLVDQSVVSNARRAAATPASASPTVASGAWPSTAPVAGLIEGNVRSVSSSRPSIKRRRSASDSVRVALSSLFEMVGVSCIILLRMRPYMSLCDGNFILILGESYIRDGRTQADAWNSACLQLTLRQ